MKTSILAFFILTTVQASLAEGSAKHPSEVKKFVIRNQGCNHFSGEEPYDKERKAEIAKAMHKLRCESLDKDKADILKKYKNKPDTIEADGDGG